MYSMTNPRRNILLLQRQNQTVMLGVKNVILTLAFLMEGTMILLITLTQGGIKLLLLVCPVVEHVQFIVLCMSVLKWCIHHCSLWDFHSYRAKTVNFRKIIISPFCREFNSLQKRCFGNFL